MWLVVHVLCVCPWMWPKWYRYCCIILFCIAFFLHPMANLFFSACLLLSAFYTRLMRPNKVETGRGLLTWCNWLLYGTVWCWWSFFRKIFYWKRKRKKILNNMLAQFISKRHVIHLWLVWHNKFTQRIFYLRLQFTGFFTFKFFTYP